MRRFVRFLVRLFWKLWGSSGAAVAAAPTPASEPPPAEIPQHKRAIAPAAGYAWNPLQKFPVNKNCFCGSGVKFKKCHQPRLPKVVERELATDLEVLLKQYWEVNS